MGDGFSARFHALTVCTVYEDKELDKKHTNYPMWKKYIICEERKPDKRDFI